MRKSHELRLRHQSPPALGEFMHKMKICLLSHALSIHTKRWINYFRENGYEVHLVSYRAVETDPYFHYYPPQHDHVFYKSYYFLKTFKDIRKLIWQIRPDILHAHYVTSYGLLGMLSRYRPFIVSVWGSDLFVDTKKSFFHRYIIKKVLKKADLVTVMANHMIPKIRELGVDENKIMKVTLGIDTEKFNINSRKSGNGKIVVLSSRVFEREQNVEFMINALPDVIKTINNVEVHFYGDGSRRAACMDMVKALGIEQYTIFHGFVPHERMPDCYREADIYVSMSISDGDHVSLMETMACGLFPVVSDIPANREWVEDGKNGFLVPLGNPALLVKRIVEAVKNRQLRMGVRQYNYDLVSSRVEFGNDLRLLLKQFDRLKTNYKKSERNIL